MNGWICEQAKLSNLGRYQFTPDTPVPEKCILRKSLFDADFGHRFVLLPKRSGRCRITVNGECRSMISNFLWPKEDDMDTDNMWFQQMDGATCHIPHAVMDILHERFEGMVISYGGDVNWPPRSCDLRL